MAPINDAYTPPQSYCDATERALWLKRIHTARMDGGDARGSAQLLFMIVVTVPSSTQRMGFDDEYGTALSQEVAGFGFDLKLMEATKGGIREIIHRGEIADRFSTGTVTKV